MEGPAAMHARSLARMREDARGEQEERAFNVDAPTLLFVLTEGRTAR